MHSFNIAILFFLKTKGISQAVLSTRLWPVKALSSQGLQFLAKAEFKMPGVLNSQGLWFVAYGKRWPRASPECTITSSTHHFSTLGSFTLNPIVPFPKAKLSLKCTTSRNCKANTEMPRRGKFPHRHVQCTKPRVTQWVSWLPPTEFRDKAENKKCSTLGKIRWKETAAQHRKHMMLTYCSAVKPFPACSCTP